MGEKKIGEGKGGKYLVSGEEEKRRKRRNIWRKRTEKENVWSMDEKEKEENI